MRITEANMRYFDYVGEMREEERELSSRFWSLVLSLFIGQKAPEAPSYRPTRFSSTTFTFGRLEPVTG